MRINRIQDSMRMMYHDMGHFRYNQASWAANYCLNRKMFTCGKQPYVVTGLGGVRNALNNKRAFYKPYPYGEIKFVEPEEVEKIVADGHTPPSNSASSGVYESLLRRSTAALSKFPQYTCKGIETTERIVTMAPVGVRKVTDLTFDVSVGLIPHPQKKDKGGEDAAFVASDICCMGVSDGVGEMATLGVNPRLFAQQLMEKAEAVARITPLEEGPEGGVRRAMHLMAEGLRFVGRYGSATTIIASMDREGKYLGIANMGDCTLCVLRRTGESFIKTIVLRTKEKQHSFNCPHQLSCFPLPQDYAQCEGHGLNSLVDRLRNLSVDVEDHPTEADTYSVPLIEGDLILAGSDVSLCVGVLAVAGTHTNTHTLIQVYSTICGKKS
eukprot:GHVR01108622.1.p1 GENE.GHVR01108622.1~~GHVR01108622.1.p1  ORF type:complete len:382 (-),score=83.88 GHVR01108622.1:664-1809(-)